MADLNSNERKTRTPTIEDQVEEGSFVSNSGLECQNDPKIASTQKTKKIHFADGPAEQKTRKLPIERKKSNSKMIQFTESISAINSMAASVVVIRAKNAFLRSLNREPITQKDIQNEGEKEWKLIEATYQPVLRWKDKDFTDLNEGMTKPHHDIQKTSGGPPPPPPPPPIISLNEQVPLPPPPPPSNMLSSSPTPSTPIKSDGSPSNLLFKDQQSRIGLLTKKYEDLGKKSEKHLKLQKIHWTPIRKAQPNTIWSTLPVSQIDKDKLSTLFQVKEKKMTLTDPQNKTKELSVLDKKRSNQINIGITNLPSLDSLKTIILKMDDNSMSRDGVEKLQTLLGTTEEILMIKEAQKSNPGMALGSAEKFLLMLHSISGLECRLKLWAFKLDFEVMEEDIVHPLQCLKDGIDTIQSSSAFSLLMSHILATGNILNRSECEGFQLEYLAKLKDVKDTDTKKTLLHHIVKNILDNEFDLKDLAEELGKYSVVSKTNFDEVLMNLESMQEECKRSIGYLRLAARYHPETHQLVHDFLIGATKRILNMKKINSLVLEKHAEFLAWLGIPSHLEQEYNPMKVAIILVNFARDVNTTKTQLEADRKRHGKKTETDILGCSESQSKKNIKAKFELNVCEKKIRDDSPTTENTAECLEKFLASTDLGNKKGKQKSISRRSSTGLGTPKRHSAIIRRPSSAAEYRFSRTISGID